MDLANPELGAEKETLGIFSDLPSETTDAIEPVEAVETPNEEPETLDNSDTQSNSRRVKAKLDGRDIEFDVVTDDVDLSIIPKGLMMEGDYRKKTTEISETRKALDAEKSKIDTALVELYDQIEYEANQLNSDHIKELKENDPQEFERKRLDVEKKVSLFKKYREERDSELLNQQQALAQQELQKLPEVIPEWMDDSVMKKDALKISNMLKDSYGYQDQEIQSITDSRAISILRKAALYDDIQNASLENNRKQTTHKSSKPGATAQSKKGAERSVESIFYGN
jgi:hypothetical protein